jgi:hypothetical protein
MANIHVMQEVFSIVDELSAIPKSILGTFEGNAEDGPPTNVNDEDSGANLVGL